MADEPVNLVLEHLQGMRRDMTEMKSDMGSLRVEVKSDIQALRAEVKSDIRSLRADIAFDMVLAQKETSEQIVGLRRAVVEYHSGVIGHGNLISDLEARVRRLEQHLNPPNADTH